MALEVVGSSPISHPKNPLKSIGFRGFFIVVLIYIDSFLNLLYTLMDPQRGVAIMPFIRTTTGIIIIFVAINLFTIQSRNFNTCYYNICYPRKKTRNTKMVLIIK